MTVQHPQALTLHLSANCGSCAQICTPLSRKRSVVLLEVCCKEIRGQRGCRSSGLLLGVAVPGPLTGQGCSKILHPAPPLSNIVQMSKQEGVNRVQMASQLLHAPRSLDLHSVARTVIFEAPRPLTPYLAITRCCYCSICTARGL